MSFRPNLGSVTLLKSGSVRFVAGAIVLASLVSSPSAVGQREPAKSPLEAFSNFAPDGLFDQELVVEDHRNIELVVEGIKENEAKLTEQAVQTRAELRVRAAGLGPIPRRPLGVGYAYVNVHIVGRAFSVDVQFRRFVAWPLPNGKVARGVATVWAETTTGTSGDASFVLRALDELMDEFLNEYLKANQQTK